jgi:predicted porin
MKKSLLALAVLGAFTGAASAQSSVTLFGIVDLNLQYIDNNAGTQYTMGQDGINSSRLGLRGTEDLGGGLTASFWLEGGLNPDIGTSSGQSWTRRSTVSLAAGWGEVRLGRDYTATFWNATIFDPFGTNGVGGAGGLVLVVPAVPSGATFGTIVRANNMVGYFLPSGIAGGLYGQVQVAAGENSAGNKYFGGRLGYASGPFNVAGAYGRTQATIVAKTTSTGVTVPGDQDATQWNFGGSWNFGFMQLSGYYGQIELDSAQQDNWFIGAQAPMGQWTFKTTYGQMSRGGSNAAANLAGFSQQGAWMWALGATYDLSKRTALYGTYSYLSNDSVTCGTGTAATECGSNLVVGSLQSSASGAPFTLSNAGQASKGFQVGVRHSF